MCCDLCEYYFRCEDVEQQSALCCGRCDELEECNGVGGFARDMRGDEENDDLVTNDDDVDLDGDIGDEVDDDDFGDDEVFEEDYLEEEYDLPNLH